jgi:N-methylhydantoinase B/oxoprolinase/acetone carboxylase alpha subunit
MAGTSPAMTTSMRQHQSTTMGAVWIAQQPTVNADSPDNKFG